MAAFPQNFWVNGEAFWKGMQLDEVAFPVLLAWRLHQLQLLGEFNPGVMVNRAVAFLLHSGPVGLTGEERWEEGDALFALHFGGDHSRSSVRRLSRGRNRTSEAAAFLGKLCRFSPLHVEEWTVTTEGSLVPGSASLTLYA